MTLPKLNFEKGKTTVTRALYRFINGKNLYLVGAFFLPLVLTWLIFMIRGVYPIGEKSVLVLDLNGQYVSFFEGIRDIFQGKGTPFYTWFRSLGGEFSGIYSYYVASPFALLSVFFPENGITEFLLWMTLLKVGSSGFTFALYLHHSRPSKPLKVVVFSTCYAMTSYAVVMAHNTMWIDSLIYLPIICLGIEKIIKYGRPHLYCIMLALCFISNFYIGWMTAIFVTLYFFYYYLSKYSFKQFEKFFRAFYKWLIYSLIAAMIASVIIIPTYFSLQMGKTTFQNPSYAFEAKFDYIKLFTQMLPNSYDTVRPNGLPFIYCGLICLVLLPVYFVSKRISGREKIMSGVILALMIFSFTATTVDLFWHGLQKPNWLNYRYSYMFCFLVIVFAYEAFRALDGRLYRAVLGCGGVIGILLVLVQAMPDSYFTIKRASDKEFIFVNNMLTIWISMAFLAFIVAALWAAAHKKRGASVLVLAIVCVELTMNAAYDIGNLDADVSYSPRSRSTNENSTAYLDFMARWSGITRSVQESDDSLYRMEKMDFKKTNDNFALRIKGISVSTSTLNASVIKLLNKMGYASKSHWSEYPEYGGNIVNDSLLGIKYVLDDKPDVLPSGYSLYLSEINPSKLRKDVDTAKYDASGDMLYAFKNEYALPVMFGVSSDIQYCNLTKIYSAPDVLNAMISSMLGHEVEIFEPLVFGEKSIKSSDGISITSASDHRKWTKGSASNPMVTISFTMEKDGETYLHLPSDYPRDTSLRIKKTTSSGKTETIRSNISYLTNKNHTMFFIGEFKAGEEITLEFDMKDSNLYVRKDCGYVYYFNKDAFDEAYKELTASLPEITYFSDTRIKAKVNMAKGDTMMYTSIPYDVGQFPFFGGWTVKVDGKRVALKDTVFETDESYKASNKVFGALLAFEVPEGEHTIELSFVPRGFWVGGVMAIIGLGIVGFGLYKSVSKNRKRRKSKLAALKAAAGGSGTAAEAGPQITAPAEEPQSDPPDEKDK